ncbi:HAD family hydrolase [Isoptericola sp. b490]|uniref:HAD family hydrolase n=1 Tax=Actinotalea lenta TaxID=3064654 RepID=UPI0027125CAB|nr:HAD family hydrolase [Isoptericola sp. b490]MDO8120064.1 HAD family hydrolase [Isoptericola sp. b490]
MTRRPRLVATDLDGTLLRSDGTLSERTVRVLRALPEAGVQVIAVTARPPRWLGPVRPLGHATAICLNGALVVDVASGDPLELHALPDRVVRDVVAGLRAALPAPSFAVETPRGMLAEHGFEGWQTDHLRRGARVEDLLDGSAGKLLGRCDGLEPAAFAAQVRAIVGDRAQVHDSGAVGLVEIAAAGVTKAAGLARWAASLGVPPEDVWAFGDMPNDLEMLGWAGRGVAVAGAHPRVVAAADAVCAAPDEDGVAQELETLLARPGGHG